VLAIIGASYIAKIELNHSHYESCGRIPIMVYSFAGPHIRNVSFRDHCDELGLIILWVMNVHDVVTKIPGLLTIKIAMRISPAKCC
jgi:hypothetical protein